MGLVESKPESNIPPKPKDKTPRLRKAHSIIIAGGGRITTDISGHKDDNFAVIDPSISAQPDIRAHTRESAYAHLDRKDVPKKLTKGLRGYRRMRRKGQKRIKDAAKPAKYAPFENPPETE